MIGKRRAGNPRRVLITFRINHSLWADWLVVMGEFNGRCRESFPMVQSSVDPDWHTSIALDSDRRYRFLYLRDDDRRNIDDSADDFVEDGDGRVYSIVDTKGGRAFADGP